MEVLVAVHVLHHAVGGAVQGTARQALGTPQVGTRLALDGGLLRCRLFVCLSVCFPSWQVGRRLERTWPNMAAAAHAAYLVADHTGVFHLHLASLTTPISLGAPLLP